MPGRRVDRQTRGLVDHDDLLVLVNDAHRDVLRGEPKRLWSRYRDFHDVAPLH